MDITTEVSMSDFNMGFDDYNDFEEFEDFPEIEALQSTEMIEMEIDGDDFGKAFSSKLDD